MQPQKSGATFLVDRTLPGMTEDLLVEAQRLLHEATRRVSSTGAAVRYVRCIFIPDEDRCVCLFEANDLATVRRVNEVAQVPFRRISPAIEFGWPGAVQADA
jgi:hypothetical protein